MSVVKFQIRKTDVFCLNFTVLKLGHTHNNLKYAHTKKTLERLKGKRHRYSIFQYVLPST